MISDADSARTAATDPPHESAIQATVLADQAVLADPHLRMLLRRRHTLVIVLTFLTGAADATGFLALGGAFSSVMTGNMVLLGLSVGHTEAALAVNSGTAIVSYIVGVLIGARVAGHARSADPVWPREVTRALLTELLILVAFLVLWEVTGEQRSAIAARVLLMLAAAALGLQGSAVQRFGVPGLSSTYLTGTLTTLIGAVAARKPLRSLLPSGQVLLALMVGAAVGAVVVDQLPRLSPVLLLTPMLFVLVAARTLD